MQAIIEDQPVLDEQITKERHEIKYLVPPDLLHPLVVTLDDHISSHRFEGEGANQLPYAQHFITTVYLDTPSGAHHKAAQEDIARNVKVRMREYYDVHSSLAELATEPEQILHHQPWIWLEVKRRDGSRTRKRRARLPKRDVPGLFVDGGASLEALATQGTSKHADALQDIAAYCRSIGEPLAPACVANYQRLSWQDPSAKLRLTLDLGLAFFRPSPDLWQCEQVLAREILGDECGRSTQGVLEIKHRGDLPAWLEHYIQSAGLEPTRHSKFLLASQAVHGG